MFSEYELLFLDKDNFSSSPFQILQLQYSIPKIFLPRHPFQIPPWPTETPLKCRLSCLSILPLIVHKIILTIFRITLPFSKPQRFFISLFLRTAIVRSVFPTSDI